MPILQLQFKDKIISKYRLEKGKSLKIGRRETNDVVIENVSVSGKHAKVDSTEGGGYMIMDLNSTNGTFVNDKMITTHTLKHGDIISVGKHRLIFGYVKGEKRPESEGKEDEESWMEKTMVLDTEEHRGMLAKTASDISSKVPAGKLGVLSYLAGGEGEFVLSKKLTKIGKDLANDIIISGLTVGKVAATISMMPGGYQLSYVGGLSKPKVNEKSVKESVKLEEFDTISIGSMKATFILKG
ncbi:MAG: FHA domain-containing protein [Proteobacteria bacterium]|nr:FHA domain-containing protein [Pseudomonadota bacterium]